MPDNASGVHLKKEGLSQFPHLTQLLRVAYRGLGADFAARFPTKAKTYSEEKLTGQLGMDQQYRAVCVVLVDGLGLQQLQACRAHTPFLRSREADLLEGRTVLPSTTATALTSFSTGEFPAHTNMFGWSVVTEQGVGNLINFQNIPLMPAQWQPVEPLFSLARTQFGVESKVISHPRYADSGLTLAAFRGAKFVGAETFTERIEAGIKHLQRGQGLAYLYWSEVDHVGHKKGWQSLEWVAELEQVDAKLRTLAAACPPDAAIILTSDHGMVDVDPSQRLDLAQHPQLAAGVKTLGGEGRCVQLHAHPAEADAVISRWEEYLGEAALVVGDLELVFKGRASKLFTADALVFSLNHGVIVDSRTQPAGMVNLVGVHGSVTDAETAIPMWRLA